MKQRPEHRRRTRRRAAVVAGALCALGLVAVPATVQAATAEAAATPAPGPGERHVVRRECPPPPPGPRGDDRIRWARAPAGGAEWPCEHLAEGECPELRPADREVRTFHRPAPRHGGHDQVRFHPVPAPGPGGDCGVFLAPAAT